MAYDLKPFYINANDIAYLLAQINFKPLFDVDGNAVDDCPGRWPRQHEGGGRGKDDGKPSHRFAPDSVSSLEQRT